MQRYYAAAVIGVLIIVSAIIAQYAITADTRYDQQTESDITSIQESVKEYYRRNNRLPLKIEETNATPAIKDRFNKRKYEYRTLSSSGGYQYFEVCAEFKTDTDKESSGYSSSLRYPQYHAAGRDCFKGQAY